MSRPAHEFEAFSDLSLDPLCVLGFDGCVQRVLPSARDEDVSSFVHEQLGTGQRHTTRRTCDHRDLAIELPHDHSVQLVVSMLCTPIRVLNVIG